MNNEAINLIRGSLSRKGQTPSPDGATKEPTQKEIDSLFAERITSETDLPPMQPLFRIFDIPCFYRSELVANCGKAKSGKTTFLSLLMAAALTGKCLSVERHVESPRDSTDCSGACPLKVLWIDTEQSQQSTQEILKERIMKMVNDDTEKEGQSVQYTRLNDYLFAFNLRGKGYEVRRRMVEVAIRTVRPDLVILDGIKDLMTDINDAVQATLIMEQLMALAKLQNCCIVCVLHQNKAEQDRNMRGSIGTELTNKAFEVFQCEFIERHQMFKVSQTLSRRKKIKGELYYSLSEVGLPECCEAPQEQPRDALGRFTSIKTNTEELQKLFNSAMEGRTQRKYNELMAVALKKCGVTDAKSYYELFKEAEQQGIIRKAEHPETRETWVELTDDGTLPF